VPVNWMICSIFNLLKPRDPMVGAQKVKQVLAESFGIDVTGLSLKAEVARATGKWPGINEDRMRTATRSHLNFRP
jgi:hypothetical protein